MRKNLSFLAISWSFFVQISSKIVNFVFLVQNVQFCDFVFIHNEFLMSLVLSYEQIFSRLLVLTLSAKRQTSQSRARTSPQLHVNSTRLLVRVWSKEWLTVRTRCLVWHVCQMNEDALFWEWFSSACDNNICLFYHCAYKRACWFAVCDAEYADMFTSVCKYAISLSIASNVQRWCETQHR